MLNSIPSTSFNSKLCASTGDGVSWHSYYWHKIKTRKYINFDCTKTSEALRELDFDWSICIAAICYSDSFWKISVVCTIASGIDLWQISWRYPVKWKSFPYKLFIPIVQFVCHLFAIIIRSEQFLRRSHRCFEQ